MESDPSPTGHIATLTALLVAPGAEASAAGGRSRRLLGNPDNFLGNAKKIDAIFVFGDSVVDAGNNNFYPNAAFKSNIIPYGKTYFNKPTAQYLGLPLMKAYLDPSTKDYTQGVDFASAGSGFVPSIKATLHAVLGGDVANIDQQLQWFSQVKASLVSSVGTQKTDKLLRRSLFIVSAGGNDISWGYALNPFLRQQYTADQFSSIIIEAIYNTTLTLFNQGAKKIVLSAIGPIGCLPGNVAGNNGTCVETINDLAKLFNSKFPALLARVNANCEGAQVVYVDHFNVVEGFIKNGASHGFTKGSHACCGTGDYNGQLGGCGAVDGNGTALYNLCSKAELDQYVFWDYAHPTEKTYGILADLFIHGTGVVKPYNISSLCDRD
ncbi:hypothetical protein R1flu_012980 [Riccia fluitans]|uniref:GDSL esterase/lipase n=1 Tax=Riccia fluitans TaxID=41844 RepID=A0ABD1ZDE5_9MARC